MASTSSAPIRHKYEVFLSFRGEDTRYSFTDYLYEALLKAGITTFRDDDGIREGQELKPEIEGAITESKASVIVISKNFANSSWCLDELWLILEQKRNVGHIVLPVFYHVDPSDVRNQRGSFTIKEKEGSKWTRDNVKRWKAALREVADLKGMVVSGFRGEDTRHSFTDYLYKALNQAGIRTFRDDDEIREGEELKPEIERAITESKASVIVISKNYANSSWCLDELRLILEQKSIAGDRIVFPVFYGVDPSDVRNQRGSFKIKAKYIFTRSKWTKDNVKRWKAALREVADLKGMVVSGNEKDFIANIVDKVYHQLCSEIHRTPSDLTGIETRAESIISWLRSDRPGHPVLAICGMGGGGKTTLAEYIYYSNKKKFDSCSLLKDINENQPEGLLGVQKKLLRDISGNSNMMISDVYEGAFQLQKAIQMNKVLIVVDDIDDKEILTTLFGSKVFPTQSKIIVTTRIQNMDTWFGSISYGCRVHKIELLNDHESLELLSWHAFGSKFPMEGFEKLAVELAQYCEGSPLALKVLGSSLPVGAQDQWTRNNMIEIWRSRLDSLNSLKGDLDNKIECVLRKSFDSLPCDSHRELFLHIACLFIGEYLDDVEITLEKDWHAKSGVPTLINRCLVTISANGMNLAMHKLLQDMASKIVREESKNLAERSRIWCKDEAYQLLKKGEGSETIEGLSFQGMTSEEFKTTSLVKMKNLKLLQLKDVKLTGTYENFPDLVCFKWRGCNLRTITPGLLTSYLVVLHMTDGDLEEFDPPMVLNSLKILDLSYSPSLVSICNLIRLLKLERLDLKGCTSLTHVCKTIGDLKRLSYLNLKGCTKLWKSNPIFISIKIPEQPLFSLPQSLSRLILAGNSFEMLPSHIDLKMLLTLDLTTCPNLKSLPCLPSMLETLHVNWCSSLENITFQSGRFTLQVFEYEGCFRLCEIQGLFKLVSIAEVDEADLQFMQWIKAYQNHFVDLVGDVITKDRTFNTQMLYEYGIRSTFLQGVTDQSMATHDYTSTSYHLSFCVPLHPKKHRIQGLYVTVLYRSLGEDRNTEPPPLFAGICNRSKGVTWVYNPVVYCKPGVDEDAIWLSYWPIGSTLDAGDEVHVDILVKEGTISRSGIGATLVYMDAGEAEKEEEEKSETMKREVIGGDMSLFEVKGGFYLCRHDFFGSMIPACFFGDDIQITDSTRWRTHSHELTKAYERLNDLRNPNRSKIEVTLGVSFISDDETNKIKKAVSSVDGVESVSAHKEIGRLIVCGGVDPSEVVKVVREFKKMAQIIHIDRL